MLLPLSDKSRVLRSLYYRCVYMWNQLEYNVQHIDGEIHFSNVIRKMDMSKLKMYAE